MEFVTFNENQGVEPGTFWIDENGEYKPIATMPESIVKQHFGLFRDNYHTGRTIKNLIKQGKRDMRSLYEQTVAIHFGKLDRRPDIDGCTLNFES